MLCIFILAIVMVGVVSASEDINSPDTQTAENDVEINGVDSQGSFSELSVLVENANSSTTLELEKDYKYDGSTPTTGIYLEKSVSVDGKGHTLDACGQARMFNTTVGSTFKNIIFKNGYADGDGGISISPYRYESNFINCTFINCHATGSGGALGGAYVSNSTFINCSAGDSGGGTRGSWVSYSTFINCSAQYGGAMRGATASHCLFLNCTGEEGAVYYGISDACIETSENFVKSDRKNSFDYIQELIDNANSGDTINISGYYSIYMSSIIIDKDITIQGNNAVLDGQDITRFFKISSGNVVLKNITMVNANGKSIVCSYDEVNLKIENCTFLNSSGSDGSAIYFDGNSLDIVNSSFINCQGKSQWATGTVYSYSSGAVKVYNSTFINCSSYKGGAIYNGIAYNCEFIRCVAKSDGGAIYKGYAENSRFIECSAGYGGGAYETVALNSYFYSCTASNSGSAMYGGSATNCTFEYCSVWRNALSIVEAVNCSEYMYPLKEVGNNYTFDFIQKLIDNATEGDIINLTGYYLGNGTQINVNKTLTFTGNNVTLDAQGLSRIFNVVADSVVFKNITFYHGCTDGRGGAIYSEYNYSIQNCIFIECMAPKSGAGAIYSWGSNALAFNSTFINCLAYQGGAIWFYYQSSTAQNCTFINCYSDDCGGAMGSGSAVNCTFINCSAGNSGGAKYYGYVSYSKFINCTAGIDGGAAYDTVMCSNCEFINCTSKYGGALYETSYENCIFTDCYPGLDSGLYITATNVIKGEIVNITVEANSDVTGNITLTVNNTVYKVNLTNGRGNVIINDLGIGTYSVNAVFSGDDVYQPSTKTGSFKVAYDSNLTATINDVFIDEIAVLNVSFNENITDNIRIYLDWNMQEFIINNGKIQLNFSNLSSGSHNIWVYFDGNDEFHYKSVDLSFNVYLHETELSINVGEISQSGDVDVEIIISENATGNITVQFDGVNQSVEFTKGKATLSLHDIGDELHRVKVIYDGDWRYKPKNMVALISTDLKLGDLINETSSDSTLTLSKDYEITSTIIINKAITIDGGGHILDSKKVKIFDVKGNNVHISNVVFKNAYFNGSGGAIFSEGNNFYCDNCTFINCSADDGGAIYASYGVISNCTFINCSAVNGGAIRWKYVNRGSVYDCEFIKCHANYGGAIRAGNDVHNSKFISCNATNNGGAIYAMNYFYNSLFEDCSANNGGAVYTLTDYNKQFSNITFNNCLAQTNGGAINIGGGDDVDVINSTFISCSAKNGDCIYSGSEYVIVTCIGSKFLSSQSTAFKLEYGSPILINCTFTINPELKVTIENINVTSALINISVNSEAKGNVTMKINNKTSDVTLNQGKTSITLTNLKSGDVVTVYFSGIDGYENMSSNVMFTLDTSSSGEDTGENNNSNQNVSGNTSNNNISVVNPPVTFEPKVIASNIQKLYSSDSTYVVNVYGTDGNLVSGVSVVFRVNGVNVATAITNANGQASYKPTQTPGTYKITATALGITATNTLTVKHILSLKTVTVKKSAKKLVIQVSLAKVNGKYIKNKKITVKFNGKKYTAKTNSKGVAKVTVKKAMLKKLKAGKKVTYQATYLKDTVKKSVKVKK